MEYYKNLDLKDIVYFCKQDLINKTEKWKYIKNYEYIYMISDLGRLKSFKCNKQKILKPNVSLGYCCIKLFKNGFFSKVSIY